MAAFINDPKIRGILAVIATPLFLGVAPIFGKLALQAGADSFSIAAIRTVIAAAMLWIIYSIFFRRYLYIYPAGLLGCIVVGVINGIGSLFFYGGLGLLDASLTQLLNGLYIAFALLLAHLGGEKIDRRTLLRISMALVALVFITGFSGGEMNWMGVGLMLGSALMFAGTVIMSQYVLYEMPSPTATLYILTTMAVVVVMVWAVVGQPIPEVSVGPTIVPIILLGITTALSRLAMFASVQVLGSLRTAVVAIAEIGVALVLAFFILGDRLTPLQTVGVVILFISIILIRSTDLIPRHFQFNMMMVRDVANIQFQRIAFHRAFGTAEQDNEFGVMSSLTTMELKAIQRMMGADNKPVDPFPIRRSAYFQVSDSDTPSENDTPRA